jgi:S-adenosylmethionine synthetase
VSTSTALADRVGALHTHVPTTVEQVRAGAVAPRNCGGRVVAPFVGVALVSASTRSVDGAAARLLAEAGDRR